MLPVRFHLPGLRYNYPLNMFWVSMMEQHPEYFRENVEIGSMWKFNGDGSGNQSYELLYRIISDVNFKPIGTYTDILTFTVS